MQSAEKGNGKATEKKKVQEKAKVKEEATEKGLPGDQVQMAGESVAGESVLSNKDNNEEETTFPASKDNKDALLSNTALINNNTLQSNTTLPLTEKYRPRSLNEIVGNETVIRCLKSFKCIPNMLFYGPPGTGKTTAIKALIKDFPPRNILELNASDDRGIETVRILIKEFSSTISDTMKIVVLDEADSMTKDAQAALRRIMEDYKSTRFCLICNYPRKIIEPIKSRCCKFRFNSNSSCIYLDNKNVGDPDTVKGSGPDRKEKGSGPDTVKGSDPDTEKGSGTHGNKDDHLPGNNQPSLFTPPANRLMKICLNERIPYDEEGINLVLKYGDGDMRKMLNDIEGLRGTYGRIDKKSAVAFYGVCDEEVYEEIYEKLRTGTFRECQEKIREEEAECIGLIEYLEGRVIQSELKGKMRVLKDLSDIEHRISQGNDEGLEMNAVIGTMILNGRVKE